LGRLNPNSLKNIRIQAAQKDWKAKEKEERKEKEKGWNRLNPEKLGKRSVFGGNLYGLWLMASSARLLKALRLLRAPLPP